MELTLFVVDAVLCVVGHLAVSLASTHQTPVAPSHPVVTTQISLRQANVPSGKVVRFSR